jgi:hypothetical protein
MTSMGGFCKILSYSMSFEGVWTFRAQYNKFREVVFDFESL